MMKVGDEVVIDGLVRTVGEPCESQDGHWMCIDCGKGFPNNLTAEAHERMYLTHTLMWFCHECSTVEATP